MARQTEERDVYRIPENFVDTGTVMGGMFKLRNVIEAGAIAAVFILPLFKINISLTAKIIIAVCAAIVLFSFMRIMKLSAPIEYKGV